jgi:cell division protein FtsW
MNPWAHAFDSGYQLTQSLIAVGRGGLFGVGLGNSVQKLFYLPEAHTDFIFAVLAEELGLFGQLCLILLFAILVYRILRVAWRAIALEAIFSGFVCFGAAFWLSLQVLINISVNIGLLPTKGLTLPLISYGGSSLLINVVLIAIVLRVSRENEAA